MVGWRAERPEDLIIKSVLFLFSPFLSFLSAIVRIKTRSSFVIFYLFALFYGIAFTTESGKGETSGNDGAVFRAIFEDYICGMNFSEFWHEIIDILSGNNWHRDIYFHIVAYVVSIFTNNYHYLFLAFALVFGYFMLRALAFLVKEKAFDGGVVSLLLVSLFVTNGIFDINGMRFWTAAWIAAYALLRILVRYEKRYLALLCITPLVHSSFLFLLAIYLIYFFFSDKKSNWIYFYYFSFVFSSISVFVLSAFIGEIPLLSRYMVYLDPDSSYRIFEGKSILKGIFDLLSTVYVNVMFYMIYRNTKCNVSKKGNKLYDFFLVYISIINFVRFIPSLGARYFIVGFPLIAYLWLVNFGCKKYKWVIYSMPFFMLWYIHNSYLLFTYFLEPSFYFSNPISIITKYL